MRTARSQGFSICLCTITVSDAVNYQTCSANLLSLLLNNLVNVLDHFLLGMLISTANGVNK